MDNRRANTVRRRRKALGAQCINGACCMKPSKTVRCAIYTRVSTDQGLEQEFNSLDAQREASEAYIKSQAHEHLDPLRRRYSE